MPDSRGMEPGRFVRLEEAFAAQPPGPPPLRLCAATSKLVDAAGVGLSLGASDGLLDNGLHTVCATDAGEDGEALQFDLGEGPSYTAHRTGRPVQARDLACDGSWPVFSAAATGVGLRAVFAFPLRSGSTSLGALTLYQQVAGELTSEQYADALVASRFALILPRSLLSAPMLHLHSDHAAGGLTDYPEQPGSAHGPDLHEHVPTNVNSG